MQVLLTAINSKYIHTGLGLRYVTEYARSRGREVQLLEESINTPVLTALEKIMQTQAQVYGFSVHIWNRQFVFRLLGMLRRLRPEAVIILGGPEVSFAAESIFRELPGIVDYIVQGEGELVFSRLLDSLERGLPPPRHTACMENGSVQLNGGPAVVDDLALLPFPYPDLEQVIAAKKIIYYECSRGCPFSCAYCLSGISRSVRRRPLALVLQDLDRFIAAGAPLVKFADRTYNLDEGYFLPIMQHLAAADTKTVFHFEIKADMLSEKVLDFLASVPKGRFQLEIGIQSTHPPTLAAVNRRDDWPRLAANVRRLLSFGNMHIHVDLIAGLPFEDLRTFRRSFNDVYALQAQMLQLGFLKVLPGTQMRRDADKYGLVYMDDAPYEILASGYLPYEDMRFLKRLESVFEQTANSGAFGHILSALLRASGGDAFGFYAALTEWWTEHGYYPQSHNLKGVAAILQEYIADKFTAQQADSLIEILRYDVFAAVPGWRPAWLRWRSEEIFGAVSAFWRQEGLVRRYIPDYKFSSWRQIHKNYPIEMFCSHWQSGQPGEYFVMLDLTGAEPKRQLLPLSLEKQ